MFQKPEEFRVCVKKERGNGQMILQMNTCIFFFNKNRLHSIKDLLDQWCSGSLSPRDVSICMGKIPMTLHEEVSLFSNERLWLTLSTLFSLLNQTLSIQHHSFTLHIKDNFCPRSYFNTLLSKQSPSNFSLLDWNDRALLFFPSGAGSPKQSSFIIFVPHRGDQEHSQCKRQVPSATQLA